MRTLIIDRVKVFQQLVASILDASEIEHVFATTGKDALNILNDGKGFDCFCLSMYLDDMDGLELSKEIRKITRYRHTPIVLLTSESNQDVIKQAINSGITDIFSKSKVHELVNFIERFTQVNKPIFGKVLYIEDQNSQRKLVTRIFKDRSLEVDDFDNAEDAWDAFLKNRYNLVVTDIVLAGEISGVLLINKIRRLDDIKGDTPILAVTAFDDASRRISLYHMGITDYVTKPIIEEELIARVRNLIANQKALEREIDFREYLNSEEIMNRSMKMEAMGKLTGGIAHDYNNMLGIIMGYTDLLGLELSDKPELLKYVKQIEKASANGAQLTSKLLSFTRKKTVTQEIININKVLTDIGTMLEQLLTAGIHLTLNLDNDLWNVYLDGNDFENALMNMCINAKHAMGEKGSLTIVTMNTVLTRSVADQYGLVVGDYVRVSILDSGCGMDKDTRSRIFDPFFTTKGEDGTGLGMSQVYGFVQRSQGGIGVESKLGKGTLFTLYFPRNDSKSMNKVKHKREKGEEIPAKQYSVLIVDDEDALAELTVDVLDSAGYRSELASDANDALKKLEQHKFDVMITDIIMPGTNGYELASKVKSLYPETKIIITSGYDDILGLGVEEEVFEYRLEKPVTRIQLLECMDEILKA